MAKPRNLTAELRAKNPARPVAGDTFRREVGKHVQTFTIVAYVPVTPHGVATTDLYDGRPSYVLHFMSTDDTVVSNKLMVWGAHEVEKAFTTGWAT